MSKFRYVIKAYTPVVQEEPDHEYETFKDALEDMVELEALQPQNMYFITKTLVEDVDQVAA